MLCGTMPRRRPRTAAPPLIGVVTHELREDRVPAWAAMPGRTERDLAPARLSLRLSYTQALQEAGAIAVVLPAHGYVDDVAALLDRVDGLLISGGPDLDPAVYGQAPHPALGPDIDRVADEYEQALLRAATERRGLQALNVSRGGTLHQHIPDHLQTRDAFEPEHIVSVERDSLLGWLTDRDGLAVNSFHHQAADRIGDGLEVAARAHDGTVEALWDPAASFSLGVQWHAELMTHRPEQAALLTGLVHAACGMHAELRLAA
jgi:putative glutamine amidotransferase